VDYGKSIETVKVEPGVLKEAMEVGAAGVRLQAMDLGNGVVQRLLVAPEGSIVHQLNPVDLLRPNRKRSVARLIDVRSFVAYVNEQKEPRSRIFAETEKEPFTLTAILDFDDPEYVSQVPGSMIVPGNMEHKAVLRLTETESWLRWSGLDGKQLGQETFAQFLEENCPDVVKPDGAVLLELAKSMEATQGVNFSKKITLENGDVGLIFDQTTKATAGLDGKLAIPKAFTLCLAPFVGMDPVAVPCRFRWRLDPPRLTLGFEIERKAELIRSSVEAVVSVVTSETGLPAFLGTVERV
jgi:uncharacterized protein YfdQ (DUF2303 family)